MSRYLEEKKRQELNAADRSMWNLGARNGDHNQSGTLEKKKEKNGTEGDRKCLIVTED